MWIAASMLFSWYVATFDSYNRLYGSLGAGVGFMAVDLRGHRPAWRRDQRTDGTHRLLETRRKAALSLSAQEGQ